MTLNDIIVSALAQLDRGHDAQTLDTWRDKMTRFANEGMLDLAAAYCPKRTERAALCGNVLDVTRLERQCLRVYSIRQGEKKLDFSAAEESGRIIVHGAKANGDVEVTYRFIPQALSATTDIPELPEHCHGLIVCYVIGRERASGDVSIQRGGNIYFQMYETGKAALRPHLGDADSYRILNRW